MCITLYNGVDQNVFKLINILEVAYERTSKVKVSRVWILTSRFEALKMLEEETVPKFDICILDSENESFAVGEKNSNSKLVQKVLRSLLAKFNMK